MEKATKKQCIEALEYFYSYGFINELTTDKKYYVEILITKVAETLNIELN